jgi:tetratricopeptide (TPR) repeat protein
LVLVAAAAWRIRRGWPLVTFGTVWFFATLAPSSSVIALREGMAEHRMYLASAGLFICAAAAASRRLDRMRRDDRGIPASWRVAVSALVILLFVLTVSRNQVWASPAVLWTEAAGRAAGMWEPHYALGDAMREAGDCAGAIPEYQTVIALQPAHREAHTNLGICLAQTGQLDEAERAFRRTLEIDPTFVRGYTNLGALALVAGDPDRARDYYREALAQDPRNVLARLQLARLYENAFHDYHSAARMCGEARLLAPATPGVAECTERNQRLAAQQDAGR